MKFDLKALLSNRNKCYDPRVKLYLATRALQRFHKKFEIEHDRYPLKKMCRTEIYIELIDVFDGVVF